MSLFFSQIFHFEKKKLNIFMLLTHTQIHNSRVKHNLYKYVKLYWRITHIKLEPTFHISRKGEIHDITVNIFLSGSFFSL